VWAGDGFSISVNGENMPQPSLASLSNAAAGGRSNAPGNEATDEQTSSYVQITRLWKSGDSIDLHLPKSLSLNATPDNAQVAAVMWGPLVLVGNLGPRREGREQSTTTSAPVLVSSRPVLEWITPDASDMGNFRAAHATQWDSAASGKGDVLLTPFYRTHRRSYSAYFDVLTPEQYAARGVAMAAERERARKMEAATTAFVQPGEMQPERDFNYQSEPSDRPATRANGRANRGGTGWFSFDVPVDPKSPMMLAVTYMNETGLGAATGDFQILIDGMSIAKFVPTTEPGSFYDALYPVPSSVVARKQKVTVRFEAAPNGKIAPVFGVRMYRAK
jgi:hypothetical protein